VPKPINHLVIFVILTFAKTTDVVCQHQCHHKARRCWLCARPSRTERMLVSDGANASFGRSGCWFRTERLRVSDGWYAHRGRMKRSSATSNRSVRNERSQSCTAFERTYLKLQENVSETLRERIWSPERTYLSPTSLFPLSTFLFPLSTFSPISLAASEKIRNFVLFLGPTQQLVFSPIDIIISGLRGISWCCYRQTWRKE